MSKDKREQISALVDDEFDSHPDIVLQHLASTDEHRQVWMRYHLISDCLRGNLPDYIDTGIASRISKAIAAEPSILAPAQLNRFIKPVMGFAIAASVAVVAILGIQQTNNSPTLSLPAQPLAIQSVTENQRLASNLNIADPESEQQVRQIPVTSHEDAGSRLNRYLVNYNEYRANAGMQGMLPYVRIVSYETEEQE